MRIGKGFKEGHGRNYSTAVKHIHKKKYCASITIDSTNWRGINKKIWRFAPRISRSNLEFIATYYKAENYESLVFIPNIEQRKYKKNDETDIHKFNLKFDLSFNSKKDGDVGYSILLSSNHQGKSIIQNIDVNTYNLLMNMAHEAMDLGKYNFDDFKDILCRYEPFSLYFESEEYKEDTKAESVGKQLIKNNRF